MNISLKALNHCQELLSRQEQALHIFFNTFCCERLQAFVDRLLDHKGKVFFSGVGKSFCIAQKLVATMQSFGERAFLLSPGGLLHGDLGVVQEGDVVILLSKSGETQEILDWVPHFQERGVFLVAMTSCEYSRLARVADEVLLLPAVQELDPFNLLPTNSTAIQMLAGDLLAMALLHGRGISLSTFGKNHPAGQIGLKANAKVGEYMYARHEVPLCSPHDSLASSLKVFSTFGHGCVCVVQEDGALLGIFTDGDLRRALEKYQGDILEKTLEEVMTLNPKTICEDADINTALHMMEKGRPVAALPVVDRTYGRYVVGLLHIHVLARAGFVSPAGGK